MSEHAKALDFDLWRIMGVRLSDLGLTLNWYDLLVFCYGLNAHNSCLYAELNPETVRYERGDMCAFILADIYDNISSFAYSYATANSKSRHSVKKPPLYPREWDKNNDKSVKRIGKDPIPISQFNEWYYGGE